LNKDEKYLYELDWDDAQPGHKIALQQLGWTKEMWDSPDIFSTPAQDTPWSKLTPTEQNAAEYLGFDNLSWFVRSANETDFNPEVTRLHIPELLKFNLDYFANLDIPVSLCDGDTLKNDEECSEKTTMSEYVAELKKGSMLYLKYEDEDPFKGHVQSAIGDKVVKYMRDALSKSPLRENGKYPALYDDLEINGNEWVFWLGGNNTSTSMHYDEDMVNFLWVVEGHKRVVVIPNDERTHGTYSCDSKYLGHSCWTGIDILNGSLPPHAVEIELKSGEGIMIPHMAWHAVKNLAPTVAFGIRHDPRDD